MHHPFSSIMLGFTCAIAAIGCDTARGDYPEGEDAIRVYPAYVGVVAGVGVSRSRSEPNPCEVKVGEFGPWIDCEKKRDLAARITTLECLPADACADVGFDGTVGHYRPLTSRLQVRVVADIEGERVESTRSIVAEKPVAQVNARPEGASSTRSAALVGNRVIACASGGSFPLDNIAWTATFDGAPVTVEVLEESGRAPPDCAAVTTSSPGDVRFSFRLVRPSLEIGSTSQRVHELRDVAAVKLHDRLCVSSSYAGSERPVTVIGAYEARRQWAVGIVARAVLEDGLEAVLPASSARVRDGAATFPLLGDKGDFGVMLPAAPGPDARVEIDLGDRIVTAPLRTMTPDSCRQ